MKIYLNKDGKATTLPYVSVQSMSGTTLYMTKIRLQKPAAGEMWRLCNQKACSKEFVDNLERESANYQDSPGKGVHLCIHIIYSYTHAGEYTNFATIRMHGFIGKYFEGLKSESWKLNIKIRLSADNQTTDIATVIPVNSGGPPATLYTQHETCIGNEICWDSWNGTINGVASDSIFYNSAATVDVLLSGEFKDGDSWNGSPSDKFWIYKSILDGALHSDVAIVSSNGISTNCNKAILAAHSTVLTRMFDTNMKEADTSKIEMTDMSDEGVKAFLTYLYTWNMKVPLANSGVALELLKAGHKYDISHLEEDAKRIFMEKPTTWCDVETAFRLFLFVRNVEGLDDLKQKAVEVLKLKSAEMIGTKCYIDLAKENPVLAAEASMELFAIMNLSKCAHCK